MAKLRPITIPTEPIGSIPRPLDLIERVAKGDGEDPDLATFYEAAIRDTIERFEATGSPVVTDGEQSKYHNFCTYCVHGLENTAPDGFKIPFADGHTRRLVRLTRGPFRYRRYADSYLDVALRYAHMPVKQAVISPSALSLIYPAQAIAHYSREQFIDDLLSESETEIQRCLNKGAHKVQIDFTEGRLAVKLDPSGHLLNSFIDLNNLLLSRFAPDRGASLLQPEQPTGPRSPAAAWARRARAPSPAAPRAREPRRGPAAAAARPTHGPPRRPRRAPHRPARRSTDGSATPPQQSS